MAQTFITPDSPSGSLPNESAKPAIFWAGIWGGVFVMLALTAVLTILGAGLGFALKSGSSDMPSAKTLGVMSIVWIIIVQWIASGFGGYITGRLRTRWVNIHTHEVFFRDTAHGFIAWAVANVIMMALFLSAGAFIGHHAGHMAAPAMYSAASPATPDDTSASHQGMGGKGRIGNPLAYYSDSLFRPVTPTATPADQDTRAEANRILARSLKDGSLTEEDKTYLAQLVSARTGLPDADAKNRVEDVLSHLNADESQLRELADNAGKTASILSLCIALSMLVGAFVASVAAVLGGDLRDRHP